MLLVLVVILGITVLGYLDLKREVNEIRNFDIPALEHRLMEKVFD